MMENLINLEVGVEALSLVDDESESGLCPTLIDLSHDSIAKYLTNLPTICPTMSENPNYYCLLCEQRISPNVKAHAASAEHVNAVGAFCSYCSSFLITKEEVGFDQHLNSWNHGILYRNRDKIREIIINSKNTTPKPDEKLPPEKSVPPKTQQSAKKTQSKKETSSNQTLPKTGKKQFNEPQPLLGTQEKNVTYFIKEFSKISDVCAFYELCQKFGVVKKLALNTEVMEAYVTYYDIDSSVFNPKIFGQHTKLKKLKYMPRGMSNNWIEWNDFEHITPTCSKIFSFRSKIEEVVSNIMQQCKLETDACYSKIKQIKAEFINLLRPVYTVNKAMFFGPALLGVTPRNSILFFSIDISTTDDSSPDVVTYLNNKKNQIFDVSGVMLGCPVLHHRSTNVTFTLNIGNSTGYINGCYIRTYMAMDLRVTWLIIAFREWWVMNMSSFDISSPNLPVEWLVIFFMMQPHIQLVPTVQMTQAAEIKISLETTGKDIRLLGQSLKNTFKPFVNNKDNVLLLIELFLFYMNMDFDTTLMCPFTGSIIRRSEISVEDENFVSFFKNPHEAAAVLEKSTVILLDPLQTSLNLLQNCNMQFIQIFKNKLRSTIKAML